MANSTLDRGELLLEILFYILSGLLIIEIFFFLFSRFLNRHFQWFITAKSRRPKFDLELLQKFIQNSFDPELGWVRKPNSTGIEKNYISSSSFSINNRGARTNLEYDELEPTVMAIGDSYTFARQVNDVDAWTYLLSKKINQNILNFGVGNYGIDQSLLRLKRELSLYPHVKNIVIGVVPETICRILCTWKHYSEYGNTFAFKPRFKLQDNQLVLIPNKMKSLEDFINWEKYKEEINQNDYFYQSKFNKEIVEFPYLWTFIKNSKRNFKLSYQILKKIFIKNEKTMNVPFQTILKHNQDISEMLYLDKNARELLLAIIKEIHLYSKALGVKAYFVMLPQLNDLKKIQEGNHFYKNFLDEVNKTIPAFDFSQTILNEKKLEKLYSDDRWGGHYSIYANALLADFIYEKIKF